MKKVVMGLDLSLTASAAVVIPHNWELGDWDSLITHVVGCSLLQEASPAEKLSRIDSISFELIQLARETRVTDIFVEQYAFSQMLTRAHALGELGGVVKLDLKRQLGIVAQPVVASQARKFLCGKVPRKDGKKYVEAQLKLMGAKFKSHDEGDAFTCANFGLSEIGLSALTVGS